MNKEPLASKLVLWDYTVCVQYPGEVPLGATVSVYCRPSIKTPFRYVIVQLPSKKVTLQLCELEVFARGMSGTCVLRAAFLTEQLANIRLVDSRFRPRSSAAPWWVSLSTRHGD